MNKRIFFALLMLSFAIKGFAQMESNLIFFTQQGERFYLVVNGVRQNSEAETNVKVTGVIADQFMVKIIFDDGSLGEVDRNVFITPGTETTYNIQRNNKGRWRLRPVSEVPIAQAIPPAPNQQVIVYGSPQPAVTATISTPAAETQVTTTYQETTVTTHGGAIPSGSVGVNIADPQLGVNMNVNIGTHAPGGVHTTQTTTYHTTTTSGHTGGVIYEEALPEVYVMPGYNGPVGCPWPMNSEEFQSVRHSISSKTFEDSKLQIAKQVLASNCLTCNQVKDIMLMFTFESSRLDFAKFAYGRTFDIGNYYRLNDAFTFESSIDELNEFITGYSW
jgi:hypothetical protein